MLQNLQKCFILIFIIDIEARFKLACIVHSVYYHYTRTVPAIITCSIWFWLPIEFEIKIHKLTLFCAVGFKKFYSSKERLQHREQGQRKYGVWWKFSAWEGSIGWVVLILPSKLMQIFIVLKKVVSGRIRNWDKKVPDQNGSVIHNPVSCVRYQNTFLWHYLSVPVPYRVPKSSLIFLNFLQL